MIHIKSIRFLYHFTRFDEHKKISYSIIKKKLTAGYAFEQGLYHIGSITFKYWSAEHKPDPAENLVDVLTRNPKKLFSCYNICYKYSIKLESNEEIFIWSVIPYPNGLE